MFPLNFRLLASGKTSSNVPLVQMEFTSHTNVTLCLLSAPLIPWYHLVLTPTLDNKVLHCVSCLQAYCEKHSKKKDGEGTPRKTEGAGKGMKEEGGMTEEEKNEVRSDR